MKQENTYVIEKWSTTKAREMIQSLKDNNIPFDMIEWYADTLTLEKKPKTIQFHAVNDYLWFILKWGSNG